MGKTIIKKFGLITSLFILSQNQNIRQKKENEKIADLAREIGKNLAKNKEERKWIKDKLKYLQKVVNHYNLHGAVNQQKKNLDGEIWDWDPCTYNIPRTLGELEILIKKIGERNNNLATQIKELNKVIECEEKMYLHVRTEIESYVKDELVELEFDQSKDIVDKKVKKLIEEDSGCIYLDDFFNVIENLKKLEKERIL